MNPIKKAAALLLAALLAAGALSACAPQEPAPSQGEESSQLVLDNDGASTQLVVAESFISRERTAALEEIAAKYMADFPQTRIEIVTAETPQEAQALLEEGAADLVELSEQEQPACVEQGLLLDLSPYLEAWDERSTLTTAAKFVLASMGRGGAYLMPATLNQELVYYRSDWFQAYNEGREKELVYCRIWEDFPDAQAKLADKGAAGLVFGGQERLVDVFDSILWSATNIGRMADQSASYFSAVEDTATLFTLEQAASAVEQFSTLMETAVPQEALSWTEDQAVEAFINGEAIALLAGQDRMGQIAAAMDEGAWAAAGYPRGSAGLAVSGLEFTGFGVAASCAQPENAVHFLAYLSAADNNTHLAKTCGLAPIHTTAADLEPSLEETGLSVNLTMVRRTDWYHYAQEPLMYTACAPWRQEAGAALREFLSGGLEGEELLARFDSYWSQALGEEGILWKVPQEG